MRPTLFIIISALLCRVQHFTQCNILQRYTMKDMEVMVGVRDKGSWRQMCRHRTHMQCAS